RNRHQGGIRRQVRIPVSQIKAHRLRGHGKDYDLSPAQSSLGISGGGNRRRQFNIGQVISIDVRFRDGLGQFGTPNPQAHVTTGVGKDLRQRGSPRTCTHHCHLCHSFTFHYTCCTEPS